MQQLICRNVRNAAKPFSALFIVVFMLSLAAQSMPLGTQAEIPACEITPLVFGSAQADGDAAVSIPVTVPDIPARVALVMIHLRHNDRPLASVTLNGEAMTLVRTQTGNPWTAGLVYLYAFANPPIGNDVITVTKSAPTTIVALAHVYGGVSAASLPESIVSGSSNMSVSTFSADSSTQSEGSWLVSFWQVNNANGEGEQAVEPIVRRTSEWWPSTLRGLNWLVGFDRGPLPHPSTQTVTDETPGRPGAFAFIQVTLAAAHDESCAASTPTPTPTAGPSLSPEPEVSPSPSPSPETIPTPSPEASFVPTVAPQSGGGSAAIISLELSLNNTPIIAGETTMGSVTVRNTGNSPDWNVAVTVILPDGMLFSDGITARTFMLSWIPVAQASGASRSFASFTLDPGASQSFPFGIIVPAGYSQGTFPLLASVSSASYGTPMYKELAMPVQSAEIPAPAASMAPTPTLVPAVEGASISASPIDVPTETSTEATVASEGTVLGISDSTLPNTGISVSDRAFIASMLALAATGVLMMLLGANFLPRSVEEYFRGVLEK